MLTDEEMEEERNYQKTYNGSNDEVDSDDDGDASDASERSSERNKSRSGDKSHHTIVPMEPPGVSTVKRIRQCLPNVHTGERALDIEQEFGHDERSKLSDYRKDALNEVLSNVLSTFKDAKCYRKPTAKISEKFQEDRKIVWIFTNQDDPCHADENRKEIVRNCAKDLKAQGVELVVWPLCNNNAPIPFMGTKLYNDIAETPDHLLYDKNGLLHLDVLLLGHWKSFRPAFNVPLLLPDYARTAKVKSEDGKDAENETKEDKDANIRLDFYRPIQRKVKPSKVKILRDMTKYVYACFGFFSFIIICTCKIVFLLLT